MGLPALIKEQVENTLLRYCEARIPAHVRDRVRLSFKFRGNSVTLFEQRPAFHKPGEWVDINVAQFRYDPESKKWTLYWRDRNSRWHKYDQLVPNEDFDVLLHEVERDPTGIFWG